MQLNPVASTVLVIFYLVTSAALVIILGLSLHLFNKLQAKLESIEGRIDPLLSKAEELLTAANEKIVTIGNRTETILTHSEVVAGDVHDKVEKTATNVTRTVNAPIISLNSAAAGLVQGLETFRLLQRRNRQRRANHRIPETAAAASPEFSDASSQVSAARHGADNTVTDMSDLAVMQSGGRR